MLYLSQAIGRPVLDANGEPLGKVDDLIVAVGDRYPPVTGLVVDDRPAADLPALVAGRPLRRRRAPGCRRRHDRHHQVPAAPERDPAARPTCSTSRSSTSTGARSSASTTCASTTIEGALAPRRGRRRRGRAAAPARASRGRTASSPATCGCRRPSATSTGRTSTRSRRASPRSGCACPHAGLTELHPADLATIIDQLAPRDRAGVLAALDDEAAADAIEEMEPETQVEVLEDLEPGARRRHPRGDVARRRGRPRRRPVRTQPARRSCALMERDEADELGEPARLSRGHGRRDDDHRVRGRAGRR